MDGCSFTAGTSCKSRRRETKIKKQKTDSLPRSSIMWCLELGCDNGQLYCGELPNGFGVLGIGSRHMPAMATTPSYTDGKVSCIRY